ncbi:MAG: RNA-binding protein [FCB group bacterium]|nr:RNA-binding protein [FCB group bacterium]
MKIYIGNLSFDTTEDQLRQTFEGFGEVSAVNIITDKYSGESRGFAFVEMPTKDEAVSAISGLSGQELNGRTLKVNEARPRNDGGGGNRGGGRNNNYRKSW